MNQKKDSFSFFFSAFAMFAASATSYVLSNFFLTLSSAEYKAHGYSFNNFVTYSALNTGYVALFAIIGIASVFYTYIKRKACPVGDIALSAMVAGYISHYLWSPLSNGIMLVERIVNQDELGADLFALQEGFRSYDYHQLCSLVAAMMLIIVFSLLKNVFDLNFRKLKYVDGLAVFLLFCNALFMGISAVSSWIVLERGTVMLSLFLVHLSLMFMFAGLACLLIQRNIHARSSDSGIFSFLYKLFAKSNIGFSRFELWFLDPASAVINADSTSITLPGGNGEQDYIYTGRLKYKGDLYIFLQADKGPAILKAVYGKKFTKPVFEQVCDEELCGILSAELVKSQQEFAEFEAEENKED